MDTTERLFIMDNFFQYDDIPLVGFYAKFFASILRLRNELKALTAELRKG
ncbi:MAG: hypothetical protein U1D70_12185 [Methylobacter sp.]|nr:hypothetical protein [Methylobacter sp.]